jgi:hypothetical protein
MECCVGCSCLCGQLNIRRFGLSGEKLEQFSAAITPRYAAATVPSAAMSSTDGAPHQSLAVPALNMSVKAKGATAKLARKVAAAVHAHADDDD